MHYRRLGRTNLQVSEIGLGTVELGMDYGLPVNNQHVKPSEADATRLLNQALDWGVNFIDTARSYGTSEEVIGKAIGHRRHDYILASKVHYFPDLHGDDLQQAVEKSVYDSLHALKTDYIDLMQVHSVPSNFLTNELLVILQGFKTAGHIRFIGATTYGDNAIDVIDNDHIDCVQVAYNLVDRSVESYILLFAQRRDIGIIARSVLLRGALTEKCRTVLPESLKELQMLIGEFEDIAYNENLILQDLAYRFVLSNPTVSVALCGTAYVDELAQVIVFSRANHVYPIHSDVLTTIRFHHLQDRNQLKLEGWSI